MKRTTTSELNQLCTDLREWHADFRSAANDFEKRSSAKLVDSAWTDLYMAIEYTNPRVDPLVLERARNCLDRFDSCFCYELNKVVG